MIEKNSNNILQRILYYKNKPGDYADSDRGSAKDFLLSLLPRNEVMVFFQVLFLWGYIDLLVRWDWAAFKNLHFQQTWEIFYILGLIFVALQTLAFLANFLRAEAFFILETISGFVLLILFAARHLFFKVPLTWNFVPGYLFIILFTSVFLFSSEGFRSWYFPLKVSRRMRPRGFPPRQPGRHRILLIDPVTKCLEWGFSSRRFDHPSILPYLAALVPKDWDVMILDQVYDEIDFDADVDVIGITTMGRFYTDIRKLAVEFQKRGKTVIVGGPDCTLVPEHYLEFTDAILRGNAEGYLERILTDWKNQSLKKIYHNPTVFDLKGMALPRYDLLPLRRYANKHNILVSTSCPFNCSFCTYNRTREPRLRPVNEVLDAVKATPAKYFWFEAPELLAYKKYIKELEVAFKGKKIEFSTHASMRSSADDTNVRAAYAAGLRSVWLGLESYNQDALNFANKKMNQVDDYAKTFAVLDRVGISAIVHMMFGFPSDQKSDYVKALKGLVKGKSSFVETHMLGVYSGDEAFEQKLLAAGGRPLDLISHIENRDDFKVRFYKPRDFTDADFGQSMEDFVRSYYSTFNILRRLLTRSIYNFPNLAQDIITNFAYKCYGRTMMGHSFNFEVLIEEPFELPRGKAKEFMNRAQPVLLPYAMNDANAAGTAAQSTPGNPAY